MQAICNGGCNEQFAVDLNTSIVHADIEKTSFTCPHCNKEYVAFYTNLEVRDLQDKVRRWSSRGKDVRKLQEQNKTMMQQLRKRIEEGI